MTILALKEAGSEMIMDVASAEVVEGKFGPQVKFTNVNGDLLFVPEGSVMRQLDRLGVGEVPEISGRSIHISRSQPSGPQKTVYWNFDKANANDYEKANALAEIAEESQDIGGPLPGEEMPRNSVSAGKPGSVNGALAVHGNRGIRELHSACFADVLATYVPNAKAAGVPVTLEGVSALTFQLFKAQADAR